VVTVLNEALQHVPASARNLSIQLDGASENWSSVVMAFSQLLVECGRFDEVGVYSELLNVKTS
jgi:hypothetical protein